MVAGSGSEGVFHGQPQLAILTSFATATAARVGERVDAAEHEDQAEQQGLIVRAIGDTIAFCPPLVISEPEIEELLKRFEAALDATAASLER